MVIGLAEFLEKVGKLKKTQEKVDALKHNDSIQLRIIFQSVFDPAVVWLLPPGDPPYKPNELVDQQHVLVKECEKIKYFIKGFHDEMNQSKREMMFVQLLERVDPADAKLLLAIKDKRLPFNGITIQHVAEGLPGLLSDEVVKNYKPKRVRTKNEDSSEEEVEEDTNE